MAPKQKPGKSRQDYETPWSFIYAVEKMIGEKFSYDLAATGKNSKAPTFLSDSLNKDWNKLTEINPWCWLNPPFAHIKPWAKKCSNSAPIKIAFLVPASIGSDWFEKYVWNKALVLALRPRISFDGIGPYPKDCILALYGKPPGFALWRWTT